MQILLTIVHIVICFFLVIVVLLQSGKAADLAGAFGGMGSQTAFGPRGSATVLSKATTIAAVLFMITSMTLAIMAVRSGKAAGTSVLEEQGSQATPAPQSGQPSSVTVETPGGKEVTTPVPEAPNTPPPAQSQQPAPNN